MRKMNNLCTKIFQEQITREDIAKWIGRKRGYVQLRLSGKEPFTVWEAYIICEKLRIPLTDLYLFFPWNGIDKNEI